ncbi:3 beta-hydroxysteroid dehydrogenase/Delta 5--_4-isomerase type 1-like [Protopterus annectens]|uniref:3 beta-hydroxysteroid dehydrogenase/Delta 5-->4-isomerase type 1-like n=1 Tax=Protopterus annectens TaxID=7888 RepID=UPI001CF9ADB5|nr:3 beta-hydroxysteroid dehydrogenase/Delta 5-->4-isomerase type 1-like [Protopterus annectens]
MSQTTNVYLVTGASGFLGQWIIKQMLKEEEIHEIRMMDKVINPELLKLKEECNSKMQLKTFEGDIRDKALLQKACCGVKTVIHTACIIDVIGAVEEEELEGVNVKGTQLLLEASIQENVKFFIYTSSVEVVGPNAQGDPIIDGDEDTVYKTNLKFPYSKTKHKGEQLVLKANGQQLKNNEKMVTCTLRPMYIFGENSKFILRYIDDAIKTGNILVRNSRPEALVNPVYVGNVAWAHVLLSKALQDPEKARRIGGKFYFISDDTPHMSYADLNYEVAKDLGFRIQPRLTLPLPLLYVIAFLLELVRDILKPFIRYTPYINRPLLTMLNTPFSFIYKKAKKDFDYSPCYSWEEARKRTSEWIASVLPQHREYVKCPSNTYKTLCK